MKEVFKQVPLYRFLMFCNETNMDKSVLDCGAGGDCPPLSLFSDYGYQTHGIEFSKDQMDIANQFANDRKQILNIKQGDMRELELQDESFSFVYSYNSVFHMEKTNTSKWMITLLYILILTKVRRISSLKTWRFCIKKIEC